MVYFTSDTHLGHNNILKYRPQFSSIEEHDTAIFDSISKLTKRDDLFILGDFIFDSPNYQHYISTFSKFPCNIRLVMGNHDSRLLYNEPRFDIQLPLFSYKNFWISHCPIHPRELRSRIANIHGHLHGVTIDSPHYFNVNLDNNNFQLVSLDTIKSHYKEQLCI